MKKVLLGGLLATAMMVGTAVVPTAALAAKGGTDRPISVSFHQTGSFIPFFPYTYSFTGTGIGSHIGKAVVTASGSILGGTTVFTAANGDTFTTGNIRFSADVPTCPPELPFSSASDEEIIAGTGRFAGATGTLHIASCAGFPGGVLTADSVATGTISY